MRTLGTVTAVMAEPNVLTMVLAGGEGKRLAPLTADRAKPAVPFGGPLPHRRLRPVEHGQCRLPADRGADPVQEPQPRPPHHPDLAAVDAARQLRDAGAGPDAAGAPVVRRLGRRHLPEPQPGQRRGPGVHPRVRGRPHLPDGPPPDARAAHRHRGRRDGGRDPGAALAGRPARGHRPGRGHQDRQLQGEARRGARACPTPPTRSSPRWATTSSPPRRWSTS